jgi:hypothetical protein
MKLIITQVTNNSEDMAAMFRIRQEVFERELGIALAPLRVSDQTGAVHLLAYVEPGEEPVATLSVVDTSGNHQLHERYGLTFSPRARTARYTQLAVLKPYRGLSIPLRLILEAHHLFVVPGRFDYTWLLFDANRAATSSLCQWLAFIPSVGTFPSEYGLSRSLLRDESASRSKKAILQIQQYFEQGPWPVWVTEQQLELQAR